MSRGFFPRASSTATRMHAAAKLSIQLAHATQGVTPATKIALIRKQVKTTGGRIVLPGVGKRPAETVKITGHTQAGPRVARERKGKYLEKKVK